MSKADAEMIAAIGVTSETLLGVSFSFSLIVNLLVG